MTTLIALAIVFCIFAFFQRAQATFSRGSQLKRAEPPNSPTSAPRSPTPPPSQAPQSLPRSPHVYRPRQSSATGSGIKFIDSTPTAAPTSMRNLDLEGLVDAFTGVALDLSLGLYVCGKCGVFYQLDSFVALSEVNSGRCASCGSAEIRQIQAGAVATEGLRKGARNHAPQAIALANFRSSFGRVITFEGRVVEVRPSRRGSDYAVMFERASWTKGLKLVCFRGNVRKVGGAKFIQGLDKKYLRVRGLLIDHPKYGPEIIITHRAMILEIRQ